MLAKILPQSFCKLIATTMQINPLVSLVAAFTLAACGGQIKNKQELTGNFDDWDVKVPVVTETILPKKEIGEAFVFELKDKGGVPISKLPVDVLLVPYEMNADKLESNSQAVLAELWQATKGTQASPSAAQASGNAQADDESEETVGRVLEWDKVSRDDGKVRVWLKSPSEFNKKVVILLRVGDGGFEYYTFATYQTADYSSGAKLGVHFQKYESCALDAPILNEKTGTQAQVGECFAIFVKILEDTQNEKIYTSFNGSANIISEANPSTSWAQVEPKFLSSKFTCQFVNGVCIAPVRAKLSTVQEFPLTLRFEDEREAPKKFSSNVTTVANGKKAGLVLKTNPGAPSDANDTPIFKIDSAAGENKKLSAVWVDAGGNFIEDATTVEWAIPDNNFLNQGLPENTTSNSLNYLPTKTGKGFLTLLSEGKGEFKPVVVDIPSGPFVKWGVRINKSVEQTAANAITAGKCVDVDLFASDAFDNVNSTINATGVSVILRIEGAESGPVVADTAHFEGTTLNQRQLNNLSLKDGEAAGVERICLYDATDVSPFLSVTAPLGATQFDAIEGRSQNIHLAKGTPARLALVFPHANPDEVKHACAEFTTTGINNSVQPCIVESVAANANIELRAAAIDTAGNFLNYVDSVWQQNDSTNSARFEGDSKLVLGQMPNGANELPIPSGTNLLISRASPSQIGDYFQGTSSAITGTIRYSFEVISNVPTRAVAIPCVNSTCTPRSAGVFSTDQFGMQLLFKDADNNTVSASVGTNPKGYKEKIPFSVNKPRGQLLVHLLDATGSKPHNLNPNTTAICPRNGSGTYIASGTTCVRDLSGNAPIFASTLDPNNNLEFDAILVPPTPGMYFQSPGRDTALRPYITGEIQNFSVPGYTVPSLPVQSPLIDVLPSSNYFFEVRDALESIIPFADPLNASQKLIIQTNSSVLTGKALSIIGYDYYGNTTGPLQSNIQWSILDTGESATCDTITNGLVDTTGNRANSSTKLLQDQNSFILNSPCELKGTATIVPIAPPTGNTLNTNFISRALPTIEFIGSVAHHFLIEAVDKSQADPNTAAPLSTIEAGQEFYLRIIPLTVDGSVATSYQDFQKLSLSSPTYTPWNPSAVSQLPQSAGEAAYCDFDEKLNYFVHSLAVNKPSVPVCIIKGRHTLSASTCSTPFFDTGHPQVNGFNVCSADGFVSHAITGSNATLVHVTDLNPSTTISNGDAALNRLMTQVEAGEAAALKLANKCGGPAAGALPWHLFQSELDGTTKTVKSHIDNSLPNDKEFFEITTDDTVTLIPVLTDASGNYITDVSLTATPTLDHGTKNIAGGGTTDFPSVLSMTGLNPSVSFESIASGVIPGCSSHSKLTINPRTISDINSLKALATAALRKQNFDKITVIATDGTNNFSQDVTFAINSGKPAQATVKAVRVDLASPTLNAALHQSDNPDGSGNKHLSPGDCAEINVSATDGHLNPVISFDETVDIDIRVLNYINKTSSETFFQPGGLYEATSIGGSLALIPRYKTSGTYVSTPAALGWASEREHTPTDFTDPDQSILYVGHERLENKGFSSGRVSGLNRYMCVFDASPGGNPQVEVKIGELTGVSESFTVVPHTQASQIDVQDTGNRRLCRLPATSSSGVMLPHMVNNAGVISFSFNDTNDICTPFEVTNTAQEFVFKTVDPVGNEISGYTVSNPTLSSPLTGITKTFSGSTMTVVTSSQTSYTTTDTIAGSVGATSAGHTINHTFDFKAIAKRPASFDYTTTNNSVESADNAFNVSITAKDQFGNFINDPHFSWKISFPTITYSPTTGSDPNIANGPRGDSISQGLAPAAISSPLTFQLIGGKWVASTAEISPSGAFHLKKNTAGGVNIHLTGLFTKGTDAQGTSAISGNVSVETGVTTETIIIDNSTNSPLVEWDSNNPNDNPKPVQSSATPYIYNTKSFDAFGNSVASPASVLPSCVVFGENRFTGNSSDVANCSADALVPGRILVNVLKSGELQLGASRGSVNTPLYKVRFNPAGAALIRIVRTDNAGTVVANDPVVAGTTVYFRLELVDAFANIMTTTTEDRNINWSISENYPDISEGGVKVVLPSNGSCLFTAGVCPTIYSVTPRGSAVTNGKIFVDTVAGTNTTSGNITLAVNTDTPHHFRVEPHTAGAGSTISKEARRDNSSNAKFSVDVTVHDQFGNIITPDTGFAARKVNLKIVRDDGATTSHPTGNGLIRWGNNTNVNEIAETSDSSFRVADTDYFFTAGNQTLTVENIAYDENGIFRIIATDEDNSSFTTPLTSALPLTLNPSIYTLKDLYINTPATLALTAGETKTLPVVARDWYDNPLRGLDTLLSSNDFPITWNNGLPSNGATLPATFNFVDGLAAVDIRLEQVNATGSNTTRNYTTNFSFSVTETNSSKTFSSETASTSVILSPAPLHRYEIKAYQSSNPVPANATKNATPSDKFAITVTAYDEFGNRRQGEAGLNLIAEKDPDDSLVGGTLPVTPLRKPNGATFTAGFDANFTPNGLDLTTGTTTLSDVVYLVPQKVHFKLAGTSVTQNESVYIQFNPHIDTVNRYSIAITETADITDTGALRTHGDTDIQIRALDIEGNPVPNIDTQLNNQTYTFSGANGSVAYPSTRAFDATGIWNTSVNFAVTQPFAAGGLTITDNHTDVRSGANAASFGVFSRFDRYVLEPGGTAVAWTAGSPAQLKVVAAAKDGLPVQMFDSVLNNNSLIHTWTGLDDSPNGATPLFNGNSSRTPDLTFENGIAFIDLTAVKKDTLTLNDTSKLSITDNLNAVISGESAKTGSLKNTVQVNAGLLHKYTVTSNQSTRTADEDGLFSLTVTPLDVYGNTTLGEVAAALQATTGDNSNVITKLRQNGNASFNPDAVDLLNGLTSGSKVFSNLFYPVADTNVTFKVVGQDNGVNTASTATGSITFTPTAKTIVRYDLTPDTTTPVAGTNFNVTVTGRDIAGNQVTGLPSAQGDILRGKNFKIFGPSLAPNGDASTPSANTDFTLANFTNDSVATLALTLTKAETLAIGAFRLEDDSTTARVGSNTAAWVVGHGDAATLHTDPQPNKKAGEEFTVDAVLKDSKGNPAACPAGQRGLLAVAGYKMSDASFSENADDVRSTGGFSGTTAENPVYLDLNNNAVTSSNTVQPTAANNFVMSMKLKLFKKGVNRLNLQACNENITNATIEMNITESDTVKVARISTAPTRPANGDAQMPEMECRHSGADLTNVAVNCPQIYSYFWDEFGNTYRNGSGLCRWSVTKAHNDHNALVPAGINSSTTNSVTPSHTGPINANIECASDDDTSVTTAALLFGGISKWDVQVKPNTTAAKTASSAAALALVNDADAVTVGSPLTMFNIKAYMYKGNSNSLVDYVSATNSTHQITVDKSSFGATSGVANLPSQFNANLISNTGMTANSDIFNFPFSGGYADKSLKLTLRGLDIDVTNIDVNTGTPETIKFNSTVAADPVAGTQITEVVHVLDAAGNFANCNSLNVSVVGGGSHGAPANGNTIPGQTATFFYDTTQTLAGTALGQFNVNITFYRVESITLEFKTLATCGAELSLQKTYTPTTKTDSMHARLSHLSNPAPETIAQQEYTTCQLGGSGLGMTCPTVYVHVWDHYGNYVENATCDSWNWHDYDGNAADSIGANPTLGAGTQRSQALSGLSGFVDGRLTCERGSTKLSRNGVANGDNGDDASGERIHTLVSGGITGFELTMATAPSSTDASNHLRTYNQVNAAENNITVQKIVAKMRKKNVSVVKDDFPANATETIVLSTSSTSAGTAAEQSRTLTSGSHPIIASTTVDCRFNANGECRNSADSADQQVPLNFKIVESAPRTVTLTLRTLQEKIAVTLVKPAVAASATVDMKQSSASVASVVAGTNFDIETTVRDAFGNLTDRMSDNINNACAVANVNETGNSLGASDANPSTGLYRHTAENLTVAGTKTITVGACGLSAVTRSLTVVPDVVNRVTLSTDAAGSLTNLGETRCPLALTGSGAVCPALYATVLDQFDNRISGKTCDWTWTQTTPTDDDSFAGMTAPSLSSTSGTTNTTVTHSDYFDGSLICTLADDNTKSATTQLYGGIGKVELAWAAIGRNASGGTTSTPNVTTVVAGNNNILLSNSSSITLQAPVKGVTTPVPAGDFVAGGNATLPITFTSTESASSLPTNKTAPCNFTSGICSDTTYSFNFTKANDSGTLYEATVSVRGKTATIPDILVNPAKAHRLQLSAKVAGSSVTTVTTDTQFNVEALVKDEFGNLTDLNTIFVACPAPASNNVTVDTTGVRAKPGSDEDNSLSPAAASRIPTKVASTVGTYNFANFQLLGINADGTNATSTLKFSICGVDKDITGSSLALAVTAGTPKSVLLNNSPTDKTTAIATLKCPLGANAGVSCPAIHAHVFDANGNIITGSAGTCTSWSATNIPSGTPTGLVTPAFVSSAATVQNVTSTGAISSTLTCNNTATGFTTSSIKLYGGIAALELDWDAKTFAGDNTAATTSKGTSVDAQDDNIVLKSIKFKSYNENGAFVDLGEGIAAESVSFSTNASAGATNVNPISAANVTCNMTGTQGTCDTDYNFTFNKAGETDRALHVDIRGIRASITGINVAPGVYVDNLTNSIATSGTVDTPITTGSIELRDKFNNRTASVGNVKNCTSIGLAYDYAADGTNFSAADPNANAKSPLNNTPVLPATLTVSASTTGKYDLPTTLASALKLVRPGTYRLTPTACTANLASHDVAISAGTTAIVRVFDSVQSTPNVNITSTSTVLCPHTNATDATIYCPPIHAYFFDSQGNQTADACTNWNFVKNSNSNDSQTPAFTNANSATTTLTASDWIDGTLECTKGNAASQLTIYGGTERITAAFSTTTPTASASQNVTLSSVTLYQRKQGNSVPVATARTGETVDIATTAVQATSGSPAAVIASNADSYTCNSAANTGVCTGTAPAITLSTAESATITLTVRGKQAVTNFTTHPAIATSADLTLGTASPWTAGTAYSADFIPKDNFGNPSNNGCSSIVGTGGTLSATTQLPLYGTVGAWNNKYTISGITLYDATQSQNLTYTCNNNISAQQTITVNENSKTKISISTSATKPSYANAQLATEIKCTLASGDNSNTTLTCPTVYAWGYDSYGNTTADNDCLWQKSEWTGAAFGTASNADGNTAKASFTPQHSGTPLNAKLTCGNAGIALLNTNNIYGGVDSITLALAQASTFTDPIYTTTATNIRAAPSNVIISQINAYAKRENTLVPVPGIGSSAMNLGITVAGVVTLATDVDQPTAQCTFDNATSQCSSALAFTFKKVNTNDADTRPQITVNLKGKTKTISVSPIEGGNGSQLALTTGWPAADTTTIGTAFTASFQVKDQYGNIASLSPSGRECDQQVATPDPDVFIGDSLVVNGFQSGVYANTFDTPTITASDKGLYSVTATILKAATHNVTLSACGLSLTKTLTTNLGTVDRVMLTSTSAAPTQYSCENPDANGVCEVVHPMCAANATAECGPFYAWQFDQGGNILSNAASECQAFTKQVITGNDWDQQTTASPHKFKVVSTATGKHLDGSVRCSQIANTAITKGTKIRFKAPTKVTPTLACHPWGIDLAGQPEALCIIDNQTGYTMSSVSLRQCEQTTADTQCGTYSTTNEPAIDAIVSGHCYNLGSKETGIGIKGHKCSIKILGFDNKISPVLWAEFSTSNGEQVQFNPTRPVRIPKVDVWPDKQIGTADNGLGSTCTNNETYPADQAAACDSANAGKIDTSVNATKHGLAHYKTGRSGADISCAPGNTTNPRTYKVEYVAIGDPPPLWNDNDAEANDFVEKLSSGTDVTFSVKDTCEEGTNLAQSERCKLKFEAQGPFFEGVFKVWPAKSDTDLNKGSNPYIIRTGESPICPVDGY